MFHFACHLGQTLLVSELFIRYSTCAAADKNFSLNVLTETASNSSKTSELCQQPGTLNDQPRL